MPTEEPGFTRAQVTDELASELIEATWRIRAGDQELDEREAARLILRFCVTHADMLGELCAVEGKGLEVVTGALLGGLTEAEFRAARKFVLGKGSGFRHLLGRAG